MVLVAALVSAFGAASGCGVQQGQEQIEKARQVEDSQRDLENKPQEQSKEAQ